MPGPGRKHEPVTNKGAARIKPAATRLDQGSSQRDLPRPSRGGEDLSRLLLLSGPERAEAVMRLQRLYGNRRVQRMLSRLAQPTQEDPDQVTPELAGRIETQRGSGRPMELETRTEMETRFGHDFQDVRVHIGPEADALNQEVHAEAFTTGQDLFFSQGAYAPDTPAGKELLAHELAHVVQQASAPAAGPARVTSPDDAVEREATAVAEAVVARQVVEEEDEIPLARQIKEEEEPNMASQAEEGGEFDTVKAVEHLGLPVAAATSGLNPSQLARLSRQADLLGLEEALGQDRFWQRVSDLGGGPGAADTVFMETYVGQQGLPLEAMTSGLTVAQFLEIERYVDLGLDSAFLRNPETWRRITAAGGGQTGLDAVVVPEFQRQVQQAKAEDLGLIRQGAAVKEEEEVTVARQAVEEEEEPLARQAEPARGEGAGAQEAHQVTLPPMYVFTHEGKTYAMTGEERSALIQGLIEKLRPLALEIKVKADAARTAYNHFLQLNAEFPVVSFVSELLGSANLPQESLITSAEVAAEEVNTALASGDLRATESAIGTAEPVVNQAINAMNEYRERVTSGAGGAITTLQVVKTGAFVTVGVLGGAILAAPVAAGGAAMGAVSTAAITGGGTALLESVATSTGEAVAGYDVSLGDAALKALGETLFGAATGAAGTFVSGALSGLFKQAFFNNYLSKVAVKELLPELAEELGEQAARDILLTTGQKAIADFFGSVGQAPLNVAAKAAWDALVSGNKYPSTEEFVDQVVADVEKAGFSEFVKAAVSGMAVR